MTNGSRLARSSAAAPGVVDQREQVAADLDRRPGRARPPAPPPRSRLLRDPDRRDRLGRPGQVAVGGLRRRARERLPVAGHPQRHAVHRREHRLQSAAGPVPDGSRSPRHSARRSCRWRRAPPRSPRPGRTGCPSGPAAAAAPSRARAVIRPGASSSSALTVIAMQHRVARERLTRAERRSPMSRPARRRRSRRSPRRARSTSRGTRPTRARPPGPARRSATASGRHRGRRARGPPGVPRSPDHRASPGGRVARGLSSLR